MSRSVPVLTLYFAESAKQANGAPLSTGATLWPVQVAFAVAEEVGVALAVLEAALMNRVGDAS